MIKKWFSLEKTVCVLAGSAGALGSSCFNALSECGAMVISFDLKGSSLLVDITNEAELTAFFTMLPVKEHSDKEWIFINATYPRTELWGKQNFEQTTLQEFNQNVSLHLGSAFSFTQKAVSFLSQNQLEGSILNFSSIYGILGPDLKIYEGTTMVNPVPYSAIKSGIIGLSRYVATAYGSKKIRSNVIAPGGMKDAQPESFIDAYEKRTPLGRMGTTEDIAGVACFLASRSARYITGQVLVVDGGWSAW